MKRSKPSSKKRIGESMDGLLEGFPKTTYG